VAGDRGRATIRRQDETTATVDREPNPTATKGVRARPYFAVAAVVGISLAVAIWASDQITLEGERTIYTVRCDGGDWKGLRCAGRLAAGDRYRYRASRSRNEVIFWVAGSSTPSGKYTDCSVRNRGNWDCNATLGQPLSITLQMVDDRATHGPSGVTLPFHAVQKWKWWLLRAGWPGFRDAWY
jgi:hypothetical protein